MQLNKSTTTEKIVSMLSKIFVTYGLPLSLRTDNGLQFVSDYFKKYLNDNGIEHWRPTFIWPQANGEIEHAGLAGAQVAPFKPADFQFNMAAAGNIHVFEIVSLIIHEL